jgi:hypothetical protein|tara:strand:- start:1869 stop:2903 length:1035 start_codon:yes stop_codon:yes gene_type:complete
MKIYSITEIVQATNGILDTELKENLENSQMSEKLTKKNNEPLLLTQEVNEFSKEISVKTSIPKHTENIIKETEEYLKTKKKKIIPYKLTQNNMNTAYKINIKNNIKQDLVNELFIFFKKKVKKNTLKLMIDQQLDIKNLKNKIYTLSSNINILNANSTNLKLNLNQSIKDNSFLEANNKKDEKKLEETIQINRSLEINNRELKTSIGRYISNSKKLQNEINELKDGQYESLAFNKKINEVSQKIKFFQDENARLSGELIIARKRYGAIRQNFTNIEQEKNKISQRIQDLNESLNETKTNIVNTKFINKTTEEKPNEEKSNKDLNEINISKDENLNQKINQIFKK